MTSTRRNYVIERDPSAPQKPSRKPPAMARVPSDSAVKRLSAQSEFDERVSLFRCTLTPLSLVELAE